MILGLTRNDLIMFAVGWLGNEVIHRALRLYQNWRFERTVHTITEVASTAEDLRFRHFDGETGEELAGAPIVVLSPDEWAIVGGLAREGLANAVEEAASRGEERTMAEELDMRSDAMRLSPTQRQNLARRLIEKEVE